MFCNSRIYIALYRTKRMTDVLIYLLCIALVYAAVPFVKRNTTVSVVGNDFVLCCSNFNPVLYQ